MREAALRRITAMSAGELAAFKEKCAANGRKSAAMMTPARRAALIAQTHTPEARAHNAAAIAKRKAELTAEDPDWLKKAQREKWSRNDPETEAQRKKRSENSRRMMEGWSPEQRAAFAEAGRKAHCKPVEGAPIDDAGEVVRFDSAGSAAKWILSTVGGKSFASTRHNIYEAIAGRRETAYGFIWRRAANPQSLIPNP